MIENTKDLLTSIARAEMMIGNVLIDSAMVAQIDRLITEFLALGIPLRPLPIFAAIREGRWDRRRRGNSGNHDRASPRRGRACGRSRADARSARRRPTLGTVGPCEVKSSSVEGG